MKVWSFALACCVYLYIIFNTSLIQYCVGCWYFGFINMKCRLNLRLKCSLWFYPLNARCNSLFPLNWKKCCSLKSTCSSHSSYMQNPLRLLSWKVNKTAEDEKLTFYNIMKITHLEGIHLVRIIFFPSEHFFWTSSLGESHCAAANSKKCLFCKSPLESGSKAFSSQLSLWLKYLMLAPSHMQCRSLSHAAAFFPHLYFLSFTFSCSCLLLSCPPVFTLSRLSPFSPPLLLH